MRTWTDAAIDCGGKVLSWWSDMEKKKNLLGGSTLWTPQATRRCASHPLEEGVCLAGRIYGLACAKHCRQINGRLEFCSIAAARGAVVMCWCVDTKPCPLGGYCPGTQALIKKKSCFRAYHTRYHRPEGRPCGAVSREQCRFMTRTMAPYPILAALLHPLEL